MDDSLKNWLESGKYLPEFMRDFHDQKDLFKMLDEVRIRSKETHKGDCLDDVNWITAHVYTVDIFLWVMAKHGYTLQKSRKKFDFANIYETVDELVKRQRNLVSSSLFGSK